MKYLIENKTGHAVWKGEQSPELFDDRVVCGDETYLCFNSGNSSVFDFDDLPDFAQRKYEKVEALLVVSDDWVDPVPDPAILANLKQFLASAIDDRVAEVTERWTRFKEGYAKREAAARAYKLAGYTGDPTRWLSSFATHAKKTSQQAADIIIAQADGLNLALEDLEDLRMQKYKILLAADEAEGRTEHQRIMSEIDVIVGALS